MAKRKKQTYEQRSLDLLEEVAAYLRLLLVQGHHSTLDEATKLEMFEEKALHLTRQREREFEVEEAAEQRESLRNAIQGVANRGTGIEK